MKNSEMFNGQWKKRKKENFFYLEFELRCKKYRGQKINKFLKFKFRVDL